MYSLLGLALLAECVSFLTDTQKLQGKLHISPAQQLEVF
ncbi:hypothetical protein GLYMA_15G204866v4 [Glycine max]|nr:hypothetical protein GLYMA_15G204866v4 [Glycine max]KAH1148078.1 hypothetical protein GYH30_042975 [Glycine max]